MYYSAVKNVKEHIDGTLESDTQSALTEKKFLQIVSHKKGKSPNPVTPKISLVISPYCLSYNSYNVSLENLELDQLIIPSLIFSLFSLLVCLILY